MAHQESENINYAVKAEQRKDNFIARTTAAISGVIAGIATFKFMQKKELRSYLDKRLDTRDWINGAVDAAGRVNDKVDAAARLTEILDNIRDGKAQTRSGAPTAKASLDAYRAQLAAGEIRSLPGTTVGDTYANAAYKDLIKGNKPFVEKLVNNFRTEVGKLLDIYKGKIEGLEKKFFKSSTEECWLEISKIQDEFRHSGDMPTRIGSIQKLSKDKAHLFKGSAIKFFEELDRAHANLLHYTNDAKIAHVDVPMFDEMMKHGNDPGRMGLKLRQIHKNERVIAFAAGAAIVVGAMAYKAAKFYFKRNDKDDGANPSFQSSVSAQREESPDAASARTA